MGVTWGRRWSASPRDGRGMEGHAAILDRVDDAPGRWWVTDAAGAWMRTELERWVVGVTGQGRRIEGVVGEDEASLG
ncbi:hypothetical protein ACLOJK_022208 [Asimina triloba]